MNSPHPGALIADQLVPMPTRDRIMDFVERIGHKLEDMTDEMLGDMPVEAFTKVLTTLGHIGTMWLGSHDPDVKSLMEMLSDADIQLALKKEIEAAHEKGQSILP